MGSFASAKLDRDRQKRARVHRRKHHFLAKIGCRYRPHSLRCSNSNNLANIPELGFCSKVVSERDTVGQDYHLM